MHVGRNEPERLLEEYDYIYRHVHAYESKFYMYLKISSALYLASKLSVNDCRICMLGNTKCSRKYSWIRESLDNSG